VGNEVSADANSAAWLPERDTNGEHSLETAGIAALPRICVTGRQLRDLSEEALAALRAANEPPELFARTGVMAVVLRDETQRLVIRDVGVDHVINRMTGTADFYRVGKETVEVNCNPPSAAARDILAMPPANWGLPPLDSITQCPILRSDGSILETAGYDPVTRLYYAPEPDLRMAPIPDDVTPDDIATALAWVQKCIGEFPYADESSYANTLAALMTPVIKPAINAPAPLGLFDAPQAGTGKSLLCDVASIIATGSAAKMYSAPKDEDEWRKVITTALLAGGALVVFDNITRPLESGDLCSVLTASTWADRRMKTHSEIALPVTCSFFATGNNIRLAGDMPRRCYRIRLDAKTSQPFMRTGPRDGQEFAIADLKVWTKTHRGELLWALLTLARLWYAAGKPKASVQKLGSFEEWTSTIGGILENAGIKGFLQNTEAMYQESDDETAEWERFLLTVDGVVHGDVFTIGDLVEHLNGKTWNDETSRSEPSAHSVVLKSALPGTLAEGLDKGPGFFARSAGKAFKSRADRRFGKSGVCLVRAGECHHAQRWRIEADEQ
jgi:hypothetical protein